MSERSVRVDQCVLLPLRFEIAGRIHWPVLREYAPGLRHPFISSSVTPNSPLWADMKLSWEMTWVTMNGHILNRLGGGVVVLRLYSKQWVRVRRCGQGCCSRLGPNTPRVS